MPLTVDRLDMDVKNCKQLARRHLPPAVKCWHFVWIVKSDSDRWKKDKMLCEKIKCEDINVANFLAKCCGILKSQYAKFSKITDRGCCHISFIFFCYSFFLLSYNIIWQLLWIVGVCLDIMSETPIGNI